MRKFFISVISGFVLAAASAQNNTIISGAPLKTPPVIDGVINPQEYQGACKISGGGKITDGRQVEIWTGYDLNNLYIAIKSELPPNGSLLTKARLSADVLNDDSAELMILPPSGRKEGIFQFGYFQLIINAEGLFYGRHHEPGWGYSTDEWKPDIMQKSRLTNDGFWEMELSIPLNQMGWDKMPLPSQWKMIVARNFQYPRHQAAFTSAAAFNNPEMMAVLNCAEDLPSVQQSFPKWNTLRGAEAELTIFNPAGNVMDLTAQTGYGDKIKSEPISIPPNGSKKITFSLDNSTQDYQFNAKVLKDGKTIFNRCAVFEAPPAKKWTNLGSSLKFHAPISDKSGEQVSIVNGKSIKYNGEKLAIPCAVVLKFKPDTQLAGDMKRIYFKSDYSKEGHIYLHESDKYLLLGFQYFPWQKGDATQQIVLVKKPDSFKGWQNVIINLESSGASLYINGVLIGKTVFGQSLNGKTLGDIVIGTEKMENNFEIAKLETYDRPLTDEEIAMMGLGKGGLGGRITYFPSLKALVVEAEANPYLLPKNPQVTLLVTDSSRNVIKQVVYNIEKDFNRIPGSIILRKEIKLPELKDGEYYTYLKLDAADGASGAFLGRTFIVKKYQWENNQIGMSKTIVPPFTPLLVNDREVSALLKKYTINDAGFPETIIAKDESILAGPIQSIVSADGKTYSWKSSGVNFIAQEKDMVKYVADSENELMKMKVSGEFDYDGLLKLTLKLSPKKVQEKIDSFYIDIPVKKSVAKLFHAAGSSNRSNPAGQIPAGKGLIWGCRTIPHSLPNFIPYIWIGGAEKGICYAADWDKDWIHSTDRSEHAVELWRGSDGAVSIRLNLINHAPLGREREIVFTLLATPVKPMPQDWRAWSDNYANFKLPGRKFLQALYAAMYFGNPFDCSGRYPAFEDYEIIRKLDETRKTGIIDREFLEKYLARLAAASSKEVPANKQGKNRMLTMLQCGFNQMQALSGQKNTLIYFYTCCYESTLFLPEYPVYKDEWEYRTKTNPVKSWRDYAIYYDSKMIDAGFDGIYLDNTAFAVKWSWPTGDGYVDDNHNIQPSFGLWRMRNYIKRLATMFAEKQRDPFIFVHDTNSLSLACFSFATATMDLEWKYGDTDYQDRYSADYLLTLVAGRQGGFFPTAIDGIVSKVDKKKFSSVVNDNGGTDNNQSANIDRRPWVTRTMLACLLPHEIQPTVWISQGTDVKAMQKIYQIIWDFGKAELDSRFIGYWEDDTPVKAQSGNLLASAYLRGGKMLLVIGNYGGDGEIPVKIDCAKLGFKSIKSAVNSETNDKLTLSAANTLVLKIKKHDLALIEIIFE
ncbi:MAG: glycoside hydrolase domain-containing protein [Lentisphaerota bacterium]